MNALDADGLRAWIVDGHDAAVRPSCGDTTDDVLRILLSSRFRKGSLEAMDVDAFVARARPLLDATVRRGAPVRLTVVAFPFKVPNPDAVGSRTLPDLAEAAALRRFVALDAAVRSVYPPGIEVVVIHDGTWIGPCLGVAVEHACAYTEYFARMVDLAGLGSLVRTVHLLDVLPHEARELGSSCVRADGDCSIVDPSLVRKTLGLLDVQKVEDVERAARTYAALDAIRRRFDPRPVLFPDAIHVATGMRPGRLALWLVRRGDSMLPWYGVGVLDARGHASVKPLRHVERVGGYEAVHLDGETTPFCYTRAAG